MENQTYQTTDTLEVAYLISIGFNYNQMIALDDDRIAFVFDYSEKLNQEVIKFKTGKALVEPTKFNYNYTKLLAEIRAFKKNQKWQRLKFFRPPKIS
ncbi:MAG: DUF5659 domain-containing protein [Candidatus Calescibacterium sp.]